MATQLAPVAVEPGTRPGRLLAAPRPDRCLDRLFGAVFALAGAGIGLSSLSDNSFFWHLVTGRLILDGGVPHADPFSFSAPGTPWVAQSWLAEVLYAVVDRLVGPFGLRLLIGLLGAVVAVALFVLARRLSGTRVRGALLATAALAPVAAVWSERPLALALGCFLVLVWVVEAPGSWVGRHVVWVVVPLVWCWANLHGTFVLGLGYIGIHLLGRAADGACPWRGRDRSLAIAGAAGTVVALANPYGSDLLTFPVDLLGRRDVLARVVEWQATDFGTPRGIAFALWLAVAAAVLIRRRGLGLAARGGRRDLLVAVAFGMLGVWALRNVAIAAVVMLPVVARAASGARSPMPITSEPPARAARRAVIVALALVGAVMVAAAATRPDFSYRRYPVAAMRALEEQGRIGSRLLVDDGDAGYVILRHWPRQRVFFDDRYDMYPRGIIDDYFTMADGAPGWARTLERHRIETVVWPRGEVLTRLLAASADWRQVHRDEQYVAFARSS